MLIAISTTIATSCISNHSQKNKVDRVVIKSVDFSILTIADVDCDRFEHAFKEECVEHIIQDSALIDSLLHILYDLKHITLTNWKGFDTRATITLYSHKDTIKYCINDGAILYKDSLYYIPQTLINFIEK